METGTKNACIFDIFKILSPHSSNNISIFNNIEITKNQSKRFTKQIATNGNIGRRSKFLLYCNICIICNFCKGMWY